MVKKVKKIIRNIGSQRRIEIHCRKIEPNPNKIDSPREEMQHKVFHLQFIRHL